VGAFRWLSNPSNQGPPFSPPTLGGKKGGPCSPHF
jgi:hypothetical protein